MLPSALSYKFISEAATYVFHDLDDSVKLMRDDMSVIATVYVPGRKCPYGYVPRHTKYIVETVEKISALNANGDMIVERSLGETLAAVDVLPLKKHFKL